MIIEKIKNTEITEDGLKDIVETLKSLIEKLKKTENFEEEKELIIKINDIRDHFLTLYWISYLGYLKNIKDEKYLKTEELMGKYEGIVNNLVYEYYSCLTNSQNQKELIKFMGKRPFEIAENQGILLNEEIALLQAKEKELCRKYKKILIGTKFEFEGKEINIAGLAGYYASDNRSLRKKAYDKRFEVLESMESEIDDIFDELIKVRTQIANKLGFASYTEVGFIKMNRIGYSKEDLAVFKKQIQEYVVPMMRLLREMQKERLGLETLEYYDTAYLFSDGNANINGDLDYVIDKFKTVLEENCPVCLSLFNKMMDEGLIDLENRENKSNCGITTYLPDYKIPTFLKKYTGLEPNVTSIFHEFGHATQLYLSKDLVFHENRWPTFDICEIHSTSMEYLMYPFTYLFFGEDENKYKIRHLTSTLSLMIEMAMIDDYQTIVYDNPNLTKEERKEKWREIENKYQVIPKNHEYYSRGIAWQSDSNRFDDPFYAIDYALANVCALSFYKKGKENIQKAFEDYIALCKVGGAKSLKELISEFDLDDPFRENELGKMCDVISEDIKSLRLKR